ncbi:2-keto-4-pentenoate hydratase [Rhodococcus sp. NPDC127530]|uniref:2-keto-4-pentenoate hydratase n=1 Tax=unclassified Rhodococcus (in: high G+C Gram-positive bacteria) TaxID=192944 RepID=UPI0036362F7C
MSTVSIAAIETAAEALYRAQVTRRPCVPVAEYLGPSEIDAAYSTQQRLSERRIASGARIIGRKIGLTSAAVQRQIGVAQPDFGVLFDDMRYASDDLIPIDRLLQPKAEAEVAFCWARTSMTHPIAPQYVPQSPVPSRRWKSSTAASRIGRSGSPTPLPTTRRRVFVIGAECTPLDQMNPIDVSMTMRRGDKVVSRGKGRDCLGDPLNALAWLAATAIEFGAPLRAGDIVLSGALGPMITIEPRRRVHSRHHP